VPQPKSKAHILKRLQAERRRLEQSLASLSPDDMLRPGVVGEWSVKDVLAHLADWEAHMLVWIETARRGDPVEGPDVGLTWKQFDLFNRRIYEAHRDQSLEDVLDYFHSVHRRFMDMVEAMPEDEMLTPSRYPLPSRAPSTTGSTHMRLTTCGARPRFGSG
jgi:uncharacterized protein (TIGR03083 family)